jgi:hypothetical protein
MRKIILIFISISILSGCDREKIDPNKYVMPVGLISSRETGGIRVQGVSYFIAFSNHNTQSLKLYTPGAVEGQVYRLFHSPGDSLNFELIHEYEKDSNSFLFVPDDSIRDHYFTLKVSAENVQPFISPVIQVQNRPNPTISLLV